MDPATIAVVGAAGAVAVTALVTAIILTGRMEKPWSLLADERGRRVKAEADRDSSRENEQHLATMVAEKDRIIDEQKRQLADHLARKPAAGHGTDELRQQLEAEDAERAGAAAGDGGDPSTPVPRVTSPGSSASGTILSR